ASTFLAAGVSGSVAADGSTATFTPSSALTNGRTNAATLTGGSGGAADVAGNPLATDENCTFTVASAASLSCGGRFRCVGPARPYTTIQAAVDAAPPGDTVLVHDGQYRGFIASRSGSSSNRITIMAAGSGVLINSANSDGEGITIDDSDYVTIQ